jgi:hypothetical protein
MSAACLNFNPVNLANVFNNILKEFPLQCLRGSVLLSDVMKLLKPNLEMSHPRCVDLII